MKTLINKLKTKMILSISLPKIRDELLTALDIDEEVKEITTNKLQLTLWLAELTIRLIRKSIA